MRARLSLIPTVAAALLAVAAVLVAGSPVGASPDRTGAGGWLATTTTGLARRVDLLAHREVLDRPALAVLAGEATAPPAIATVEPPSVPPPTAPPTTAPPRTAPASVAGSSSFIWPARGPIWSPFGSRGGRRHDGVDIGAPNGSPVLAAEAGVVTFAGWESGYGNTVEIDHGQGISTLYAHQSRMTVRVGQVVDQGAHIGDVGSTGHVSAPHLHYEVHVNGVPHDPMRWLS